MEGHYATFCRRKPQKALKRPTQPIKVRRRPKRQSDKEIEYQLWKEEVARPAVIERDGPFCQCCKVALGTDLDHIKGKGSNPRLKQELNNLRLLCRYCHRMKHDNKACH